MKWAIIEVEATWIDQKWLIEFEISTQVKKDFELRDAKITLKFNKLITHMKVSTIILKVEKWGNLEMAIMVKCIKIENISRKCR